MKKAIIVAAFMLLTLAASAQSLIPEEFDAYCQKSFDEWNLPAMAVVVVKDGQIAYLKGFGQTKPDSTGKPIDPETTQFILASTTKAFTGALLATVVDDGCVKWTDPVVKHLPDFKLYDEWATQNIMVQEVNCHLVGWKENAMDDLPFFGYDRDGLYGLFRSVKPTYSFRSKYSYNNEMYTVSAKIIEKYTSKSWDDAMAERILGPLKMTHSTTGNKNRAYFTSPDLAYGCLMEYDAASDGLHPVPRDDRDDAYTWLSAVAPACFVMTTAKDMANWLEMNLDHGVFQGDTIITRPNHDWLFRPQAVSGFSEDLIRTYGQGWGVEQNRTCRYIRHTGHAYGYTSIVGLVPEIHMGVAILTTNGSTSAAQEGIARKLVDMYFGVDGPDYAHDNYVSFRDSKRPKESKAETPAEESDPTLALEHYTGRYFVEGFGEALVSMRDGQLHLNLAKVDSPLRHVDGDTFTFHVDGAGHFRLTFSIDGDRAGSFTFDIGDPICDFKRID